MSETNINPSIATLNDELREAREAYYAGRPYMTDPEYDAKELQLKSMVSATPEAIAVATVLTTVGTDNGGRIPHASPMRSIENIYTEEDLRAWAEKLGWPILTLGLKRDGVSCSLTYEKGHLVKAVTRGDGDAGESILEQVRVCESIPKVLPVPVHVEVRGELVIERSTMEQLNREGGSFVSTRNLVAGTMKLHDPVEVARRKVQFFPWEVLCHFLDKLDEPNASALQRLKDVSDFGFNPPDDVVIRNVTELRVALTNGVAQLNKKDAEIANDGLVLKVDNCDLRRKLGFSSKFANFQVAFKTQNARAESTLRDVTWQVGRLGKLTPVGVIDPVVLAGATVTRVTLNNITWIRDMKLSIGSRVMVVRSGDVIPQIVEVLHD